MEHFNVNFTAPPRAGIGGEPNNLNLGGPGTLTVDSAADSLVVEDERKRAGQRGVFRLSDVANVGYHEADSSIVVRTARDPREFIVWMASREDAQALLALLPKTTTPEFLEQQAKLAEFRERLAKVAPRAPVTPTLIALNLLVFGVMLLAGAGLFSSNPMVHLHFGSDFGPLTWSGQYWRLLTAAFIHFGIFHLGFNMYALYNGGDLTERLFGSARFALIYLLSALSGGVASGLWNKMGHSAGASGAIFGVYAALLAFFYVRRADVPARVLKSVATGAASLLAYSLLIGAAVPFINNAAHVGGMLGGAVAGLLLARPFDAATRARPEPWKVAGIVAAICAALVLIAWPLIRWGGGLRPA